MFRLCFGWSLCARLFWWGVWVLPYTHCRCRPHCNPLRPETHCGEKNVKYIFQIMSEVTVFPGTLQASLESLGMPTNHNSWLLLKRWSNGVTQPGRSPCSEPRVQAGSARSPASGWGSKPPEPRRMGLRFAEAARPPRTSCWLSALPSPAPARGSGMAPRQVWFTAVLLAVCLRSPVPRRGRADRAKLGLNLLFLHGTRSSRCPLIMVMLMRTLWWKRFESCWRSRK